MNAYTKLKFHLERHMYKRGRFKGEAPADQYKRGKSHFRVRAAGDTMVVRMYNTNILTAYEDGTIKISTDGWWTSTTIKNLNAALHMFVPESRLYVSGRKVFGMSQKTVTRAGGPTWHYYDGLRFGEKGEMLGTALTFERKRADKNEREEFRSDVALSGFKDAFPLLYVNATVPEKTWLHHNADRIMRDESYANDWPGLVAMVKYPSYRHRTFNVPAYETWQEAWKALYALATKDMTEVVRTDVVMLP